jgi:N-formylglutamate amidohydrolase
MSTQAPTKPGHGAYDLRLPYRQTAPLIFSSPHSGRNYPVDFVSNSSLDTLQLRRSEDAFVDEIFAAAPDFGAPLLRALFPRAFVDANREAYELDPEMFDEPLPEFVQTKSVRINAGLGTIPRIVADGAPIYKAPLDFTEAQHRIKTYYIPYHQALSQMIESTRRQFGAGLLIDCHSMPSAGAPGIRSRALKNVDVVLGDRHGISCASAITDLAEEILSKQGYRVQRNRPYAGGFITRHYGNPAQSIHAMQIEINRALYMDERMIQRGPGLAGLIRDINHLIQGLCDAAPDMLDAVAAPLPEAAE